MTDPTKDHARVSPQGRTMGRSTARIAELGRARLVALGLDAVNAPGLRDEMCKSCACQPGSVPNGCLQTQLDLLKAVADADPDRRIRVVVGVDHEDKTVKQRAFLHVAVLPQIAEQAKVGGIRYVVRVWKEHFRATYLGDRWETFDLPGQFDAKGRQKRARRKVRISTEDLSIRQYSEYIDKVIAYGADELGVVFRFIAEEREAVRWKPKPRKARAEQREAVPA